MQKIYDILKIPLSDSRKTFKCPQCDTEFVGHYNFHRHLLTHMPVGQEQEECPACRTVITREQYNYHRKPNDKKPQYVVLCTIQAS